MNLANSNELRALALRLREFAEEEFVSEFEHRETGTPLGDDLNRAATLIEHLAEVQAYLHEGAP